MTEAALEKASPFPDQSGYYRVPIISASHVFGRSGWDLNLWDVVCYRRDKAKVAEFETEDLVAWFRHPRYKGDVKNSIWKAFTFALARALKRHLVIAAFSTGEPVEDVDEPATALRFFSAWTIFTLDVPDWDRQLSERGTYLLKPRGYLENGWAGLMPAPSKAVLNLVLYLDQAGQRNLVLGKVYEFLGSFMSKTRIDTGVNQLLGLQLISIHEGQIVPHVERLSEDVPGAGKRSSLGDTGRVLAIVGEKAQPQQATRLLEALREADLLPMALDRPQLLQSAYSDMRRWTEEGPFSALVLACRRWATDPRAGRRWAKIMAHATGLHKRLTTGTEKAIVLGWFDLWEKAQFEITPLFAVELHHIDFDRAEVLVQVAARTRSARGAKRVAKEESGDSTGGADPAILRIIIEDGDDDLVAEGQLPLDAAGSSPPNPAWSMRMDVTDTLKRLRDKLKPDDVPLLQISWRCRRGLLGLRATAKLELTGARYLPQDETS